MVKFTNTKKMLTVSQQKTAFSIVELIVVIVVIGILAAISFVAYNGIVNRVIVSSIQSDLTTNKEILELYNIKYRTYPESLDSRYCPDSPEYNDGYCLKVSGDNIIEYVSNDPNSYELTVTYDKNKNRKSDSGELSYQINQSGTIALVDDGSPRSTYIMAWEYDTSTSYGGAITKTTDGGHAITGYYSNPAYSTFDMLIAKYDTVGNIEWSRSWGGSDNDYGRSIIQTSDGGYIVTGSTANYGAGSEDMFIAKFNSIGSLAWSKTWGGTGDDSGQSIIATNDNGFIIIGKTNSFGAGEEDVFLAKYNSNGDLDWDETWGGTSSDQGYSVIQTSDNEYIVTGETRSFSAGETDMFIAKFSSIGALVWDKSWGNTGNDSGYSITLLNDGNYIVTGGTDSYGAGSADMFLAKYSSIGDLIWSKTWGGTNSDYGNSIIATSDDGFAVAGATGSYGASGEGVFITKFNASGDSVWTNTINYDYNEEAYSIIQTSDNGYIVGGNLHDANDDMVVFSAKFSNIGQIPDCNETRCQNETVNTVDITANEILPDATVSPLTALEDSPSVTAVTMVDNNIDILKQTR